jgi:hypothetical protein
MKFFVDTCVVSLRCIMLCKFSVTLLLVGMLRVALNITCDTATNGNSQCSGGLTVTEGLGSNMSRSYSPAADVCGLITDRHTNTRTHTHTHTHTRTPAGVTVIGEPISRSVDVENGA